MRRKRGLFVSFGIALFIIFLFAPVSAENLNLKITGEVNDYSSEVYLKTNSDASVTFGAYDMPAPSSPNNLSQFYSSADSQQLAVDSWNFSNSRTLNLVYTLPEAQTGNINFSWQAITGNYTANLVYYGENSSYSNVLATINMRTSSSYSASITANTTLYMQVSVSNYTETASPSCGDGSCNGVETCSSCSGDCGACPAASSGGGGGGGTAQPLPAKGIGINTKELSVDLVLNSNKEQVIKITNNGTKPETISIRQTGLDAVVLLKESSITIAPGETKEIKVIFVAPEKAGVYAGKLIVAGNEILVSLNVETKMLLFDSSIVVPSSEKNIKVGSSLTSQITLIPMGDQPRVDVTLNYVIKDFQGKDYLKESETVLVEGQKSFEKQFYINNLPAGDYLLGLEVIYPNGVAVSSSHFSIVEELPQNFKALTWIMLAGIIITVFVTIILINRGYSRHKPEIKMKRK